MILSDEEIKEITGKARRKQQSSVLSYLGIEHKLRPDGSIVVSRDHALRVVGGEAKLKKAKKPFSIDTSKVL